MKSIVLEPQEKDLGEFSVRRVLPATGTKMIGPFIFFDHMGPAEFPPGSGISVRPHPHIGIATITYLFSGEIVHRDSLGFHQTIQPGAVNLMTAGSGIVHSERSGEDLDQHSVLHGIQSWIALPEADEECAAEFLHYPASEISGLNIDGCEIRVIMGSVFGHGSPVKCYSPTRYLECRIPAGQTLSLPADLSEQAVYLLDGQATIRSGEQQSMYKPGVMVASMSGESLSVAATTDCHCMVIGGEPLGKRHIWWNFVARTQDRIERAKQDWQQGRFDPVPGDDEFIPLPKS